MEHLKKIVETYKDHRDVFLYEFADNAPKCPHREGAKCKHEQTTKNAWKDYSVDTNCTLNKCPL